MISSRWANWPRARLPALHVIGARYTAIGIGGIGPAAGLEDELIHARELAQDEIEGMDDFQNALKGILRLIGMKLGEIGPHRHHLAEPGVVLHGAGSEQADAHHAQRLLREMQVVALHLRL